MQGEDLKACAIHFLHNQGQLFDEKVAGNVEEAEEFLDDCMAEILDDINAVREYLEELGMDVETMTDDELKEQMEVFALPDGRYYVVEG